jgi:hypothetical protein
VKRAWLAASLLIASACDRGSHGADGRPSKATVTGTALDAATREPLAGVAVEGPRGTRATSDASGRFRLSGVPVGEAGEVVGRAEGGLVGRVPLREVQPGGVEIVLFLRPAGEERAAAPKDELGHDR